MFIKFLRSSFAIQYVTLVLLAILLWLPAFLNPVAPVAPDGFNPIYALFYPWLAGSPVIATFIAFFLVVFQAFYFNAILSNNQLIGRVASAGAFVYVLLMSLMPEQTMMHPLIIAMPFVLAIIQTVLNMYDSSDSEWYIFNLGFLVALATMIYFPMIIFIVWIYMALFVLRIISFREWIIPIIGLITPIIFLATVYFMQNILIAQSMKYLHVLDMIVLQPVFPGVFAIAIILLVIWMAIQSINISYGRDADRNIALRKKKVILMGFLLFSLTFIFYKSSSLIQQSLFMLPIAVFISYSYMIIKKYFWPQLLLFLLILLSCINHYLVLVK